MVINYDFNMKQLHTELRKEIDDLNKADLSHLTIISKETWWRGQVLNILDQHSKNWVHVDDLKNCYFGFSGEVDIKRLIKLTEGRE